MKKSTLTFVMKFVLFFILVTFILDKLVYISLNKVSDQIYSGQGIGKVNHYLKVKDKADLLVFGNSRANHNIDPSVISNNGFNIGVDGRKIAFPSVLIKMLNKKEQIVLLHIDPENAFNTNYLGEDVDGLLSKYNRIDVVTDMIDSLNRNKIIQKFYWSLGYNGLFFSILKNFFVEKYDYTVYTGYDPLYITKEQAKMFKKTLERESLDTADSIFVMNDIYSNLINDVRDFCNDNDKRLIVFTSPKYKDNCKMDNVIFKRIMEEKGVTYYDYTDLFTKNNNIEYWFDEIHLSNVGAEIFTATIKQMLQTKGIYTRLEK
nr:hypothetical protein [uncultured Carboxylicivirga sp.]